MSSVAITVNGISKRYRVGRPRDPYGRLTESLWNTLRNPVQSFRRSALRDDDSIWALRDVTFEVERGHVVGVIGRNGSGKTTLLKVLSRITEPTVGEVRIHGRVGALLEVGTGFHPELTGRENVYMSGAVLGMRRAEISRKFDEIVEFAGVERFLETPVKRYSSGMQVRLGFAVAAHLDPEVLFIDEVLAVGDAEFQKKCLGKMSELGEGGRTILFVSHSMQAVLRLCERAILLDQGRLVTMGPSHGVVRAYLESGTGHSSERVWEDPTTAPGDEIVRLQSIRVIPEGGGTGDEVDVSQAIDIEFAYWTAGDPRPSVNFHVFNDEGICLFAVSDYASEGWTKLPRQPGIVRSRCRIPGSFLAEGRITLNVAFDTWSPHQGRGGEHDVVEFQVVDRTEGDGVRGQFTGEWPGVVRPRLDWAVEWKPAAHP